MYVPAGKARPAVLICKFKVSERVLVLLVPMMRSVKICKLEPAAKGLVAVKAAKAPASALPDTFAEGMLSPAPSLRAVPGAIK